MRGPCPKLEREKRGQQMPPMERERARIAPSQPGASAAPPRVSREFREFRTEEEASFAMSGTFDTRKTTCLMPAEPIRPGFNGGHLPEHPLTSQPFATGEMPLLSPLPRGNRRRARSLARRWSSDSSCGGRAKPFGFANSDYRDAPRASQHLFPETDHFSPILRLPEHRPG
jgi:hypothetical protein